VLTKQEGISKVQMINDLEVKDAAMELGMLLKNRF
jgi:hypothetical protein